MAVNSVTSAVNTAVNILQQQRAQDRTQTANTATAANQATTAQQVQQQQQAAPTQQTQQAQAPQPVLNAQGQLTGQVVSTRA